MAMMSSFWGSQVRGDADRLGFNPPGSANTLPPTAGAPGSLRASSMPPSSKSLSGREAYGPGGYAATQGPPPASMSLSMPGTFPTQMPGPAGGPPGSQPSLPPTAAGGPPGTSQGGLDSHIGADLVVQVSRLLDMPKQLGLFGGSQHHRYVIRCFDDFRELCVTPEIEGMRTEESYDSETIVVGPEGVCQLRTDARMIYLQVEYTGGILGNRVIGRCMIHRLDPRSSNIWPYALSDELGEPVNCGVELRVSEGHAAMGGVHKPMWQTMPPLSAPGSGPAGGSSPPRGPMGTMFGTGMMSTLQTAFTGRNPATMPQQMVDVSAVLEVASVTDLPAGKVGNQDVMLTIRAHDPKAQNVDSSKMTKLGVFGPFSTSKQTDRLVQADCGNQKIVVKGPYQVGGGAKEGTMYITISVSYTEGNMANQEIVGETDPIQVSWSKVAKQYCEIKPKGGTSAIGGINMSFGLQKDSDAASGSSRAIPSTAKGLGKGQASSGNNQGRTQAVAGKKSPEEQARLCYEAQNRALYQRIRMGTSEKQGSDGVEMVSGYRKWDSLDRIFATMGPHPIVQTDSVGPSICRAFEEQNNVVEEVVEEMDNERRKRMIAEMDKKKKDQNSKDAITNITDKMSQMWSMRQDNTTKDAQLSDERTQALVSLMLPKDFKDDMYHKNMTLRPVICKDADDIMANKDMSWLPSTPTYVPLSAINDEDKETLRLACYHPSQCAKLRFRDVNPNYNVSEDVWGVLEDQKASHALIRKPQSHDKRRVKDECLMA
eukprot:gnl/TRDRNA2_/TRDRNA2_183448_c0_seq1.p1 gnl/TRDRNA2_/TRDRNA2_183448_c0~~gnl/TRDRNA2_/TRDRNA2_183448_c0_seq1.p1  ORF type:complete len:768 (-),score=132.17 gnl/TRDRNA2_/TRDRNA2_183448_c0_seq1:67-2370(-)